MDIQGFGTLVEGNKIGLCMKLTQDKYNFNKFRYMCILSGCDYLESLPGIGIKKALKFITLTANPDIYSVSQNFVFINVFLFIILSILSKKKGTSKIALIPKPTKYNCNRRLS